MTLQRRSARTRKPIALLFAACFAVTGRAASGDPASDPSGALDDAGLATIVVTAQRRPETLDDVPLAVSALDGNALAEAGVESTIDLQTVVPSLTYLATGHGAQPYLRGVGTRQFPIGMESSVASYIDDRYVARPFAAMFDLLDVERVEVLKGPQGTLYGRNAAAGAIRAITKDPGTSPSMELAGKLGQYDDASLSFIGGGPLFGAVRGQVAAEIEQRDGLATNLAGGRPESDDIDRQLLRGKLLWSMGPRVAGKLSLSWWRRTDWAGRDLVAAGVPEANRGAALYGGITSRNRMRFATALDNDNDLHEASATLRFDADLGALELVSISTYTDGSYVQSIDVDASSAVLVDLYATETSRTFAQELRLLSTGKRRFEWLAGLFYYREDGSNIYVFPDSLLAQPLYPQGTDVTNGLQQVDTEAYALFAQGTHAFNDRWSFTLGGRYSRESKKAALDAVPGAFTNAPAPYADARSWDQLSPHASLEYRGAFGLAYLSYSRGFKSGGYNYPASLNPVLDPEVLHGYELGLKSRLAGGRLSINSAIFYSDLEDLQVTRGGTGAYLATENAANARVRGVELDYSLALSGDLALNGGAAWIDSEYTSYTAAALVPLYSPPYGSAPLPGGLDVHGRPLLRSPKQAWYVGLRYRQRLAGGGSVPVSVNYAHKGDYYFDFSAVPETEWLRQRGYGVLNARAAYVARADRWQVGVFVTNLTNEAYYEDAVLTNVSSRVSYADPRQYGVDFKLKL
ncbi:MAG TPA: TonB-dependent receptor [Gammaproteobacteria bacterium]|nr:TonB-dependent receptor [Gammaproteobacteria bacterium]